MKARSPNSTDQNFVLGSHTKAHHSLVNNKTYRAPLVQQRSSPTLHSPNSFKRTVKPTAKSKAKKPSPDLDCKKTLKPQARVPRKHPRPAKEEVPKKQRSPRLKKLISQSLCKLQADKGLAEQLSKDKELELQEKRRLLQQTNEEIRKRNAKHCKRAQSLHKLPWGVDQRQFDHSHQLERMHSNELIRSKVRTERRKTKRKGRARIGLEGYKPIRSRKTESQSPDLMKSSRDSDPGIVRYMHIKKQQAKIAYITQKLEQLLKDNERERALYELDKKSKVAVKTQKKRLHRKKPSKASTYLKSQEVLNIALNPHKSTGNSELYTSHKHSNTSRRHSGKPRAGNRVRQELAAIKIQRWWRRHLQEPDDWDVLETEELDSEVVQEFRKVLNNRHEEISDLLSKRSLEHLSLERPGPLIKQREVPMLNLDGVGQSLSSQESSLLEDDESEYSESSEVSDDSIVFDEPHEETVVEDSPQPFFSGMSVAIRSLNSDDLPEQCETPASAILETYLEPRQPLALRIPDSALLAKFTENFDRSQFREEVQLILTNEIDSYLGVVTFEFKEREVDPGQDLIKDYVDWLYTELSAKEGAVLDRINTPICGDALERLYILQNTEIGGLLKVPTLDLILMPELIALLKREYNPTNIYSKDIYIQMLFDCVNESLNYIRPYGVQGVPSPWSTQPPRVLGENSLFSVFKRVERRLSGWWELKGGLIGVQSKKLQKVRDSRMSVMLCKDVLEQEANWLDYEDEEIQVECDLTDMVLEDLLDELFGVLTK